MEKLPECDRIEVNRLNHEHQRVIGDMQFIPIYSKHLVEKPKNFPSNMFSSSFFMIHNSSTRSENNISNTSSRQKLIDPFFQIRKTNIESRGNNTAFVKT